MQAQILREKFLNFFKSKKHKVVEPDSLVPKDDPTVLFTPAGMNQFKKEFLGFNSGFSRAATCQRCLRTDDLDKVGKTAGHHTFFEMLGNFSFGNYFKEDAIKWAWEFLTQELKIDADKLWVSVYKDDDETLGIWRDSVKVPEEKIIKLGDKENFWPSEAKEKGPNGPCGPCSEIFFDLGSNVGCKKKNCNPGCSCERFLEVWNLVFTQFNRKQDGSLEPLPNKNIDTGMGLERLAAVMQGVSNNFKTDLFQPIVKEITKYEIRDTRYELIYAIADHLRAVVFSIYDGVLPSNEARGYVVRKLIRKSCLHLRALGFKDSFLYKLVPILSETMKAFYPDLDNRKEDISQIIQKEENNFILSLNSSATLFKEKFSKNQPPEEVGKVAFQVYDTYGIPLELTLGWLEKNSIKFSQEAFNQAMKEQKERSKLSSAMKGDVFSIKDLDHGIKETKFKGYSNHVIKAKILKVINNATLILDQTPFYAESGGQIGDSGEIVKGKSKFEVIDTRRSGKVILHIGKIKSGKFKKNDLVSARVDLQRRLSIARNHTATHLLQAALRKVLGPHVQQQGSLVALDRLRFDFSHFKAIDQEQITRIEEFVNQAILDNIKLEAKEKTLKEAKKSGALAFFGEKYDAKVRVVSIASKSMELCGGIHLDSTGQIGLFKIIQEGSISSGVRRIEAVTGKFAFEAMKLQEDAIQELTRILNVPEDKLTQEVERRIERLRELEKLLNAQKLSLLKNASDDLLQDAQEINGKKIIIRIMENLDMDLLRKSVDILKEKSDSIIIALGSNNQGRALLVIGVTQDLCAKGVDAEKLIRQISGIIGGSGGGRPDFAQAGGNNPQALDKALDELKNIIRDMP